MNKATKRRHLIIVAERDPFMRDQLKRSLAEEFDLVFVEEGADVFEQVRARSPDLIVLEALLPTVDGFQICQHLKSDPATREIPVLFFTLLLAAEQAEQVGADGFLLKPVHRDVLIDTIYRLLAKRPAGKGEQTDGTNSHSRAQP